MPAYHLTIPQPCSESWAAMTPTAAGRHCAACQKTVVDFTQLTDAEILAHLARAGRGETCGRFRAGQLARSLQPPTLARPARWRTWLAAAVAVWGLREAAGVAAKAQAPTEQRSPEATPQYLRAERMPDYEGQPAGQVVLRGVVHDIQTNDFLPGVRVFIKNTLVGTNTDGDGQFVLNIPSLYASAETIELQFTYMGYVTEELRVSLPAQPKLLQIALDVDTKGGLQVSVIPPAPWHPRRFYYWTKYWLTRPFR